MKSRISILAVFIFLFSLQVFSFQPAEKIVTPNEKQLLKEKFISNDETTTVFLNYITKKEMFVLPGNYLDKNIIFHDGKQYLVYFEDIKENQIFMCARIMNKNVPAE